MIGREVPLFGGHKPSNEEREAAEVDLERIRAGGIPLGAEQRLRAIGENESPIFNSDLSAKEYALALRSGLQPIALVLGSSAVKHGWRNYAWNSYGGGISEMRAFSAPWNLARERAFDRMRQEAQLAGADAVIGIELSIKGAMDDPSNVEYVVFGTAVRETTLRVRPGAGPRLCALSGQDVDKLRRIGAETVGVVGHTSVVCAALGQQSNWAMGRWSGNYELTEVTQGVYAARHLAMQQVQRQGAELGANDIVVADLSHRIDHHEYDRGGYTQHYFIVTIHILATAIRLGAHDPHPGPLAPPVMSIDLRG